eukprot:Protomagalhaensia_wolfi_Nauph_80__5964@NODE_7_length_6263_cov_54_814267_g5_i0_p7_GENE_NODE_7_length_6263_cov_54_814267_g5_i0NODE_7_length_6263_cov_54_814267_g5_i0_p7_ORF_typecomplete_len146_score26_55Utp14/PF04615_13/2_1e23_NODE_7_length_6263_cov_54_814267_g5_i051015538
MAFALTDVNVEEFHEKQDADWHAGQAKIAAQTADEDKAGWGSWTGEGIKPRTKKSEAVIAKPPPARNAIYRLDQESRSNYKPATLPWWATDKDQLNSLMSQPVGKEWVPEGAFLKLIEPKIKVRAGTVVAPMKYRGPKSMRRGLD